jgi:hypothetical protein
MIEHPTDAALECAEETIHHCRLEASMYRQAGFKTISDWLTENANAAEVWLVKAADQRARAARKTA